MNRHRNLRDRKVVVVSEPASESIRHLELPANYVKESGSPAEVIERYHQGLIELARMLRPERRPESGRKDER